LQGARNPPTEARKAPTGLPPFFSAAPSDRHISAVIDRNTNEELRVQEYGSRLVKELPQNLRHLMVTLYSTTPAGPLSRRDASQWRFSVYLRDDDCAREPQVRMGKSHKPGVTDQANSTLSHVDRQDKALTGHLQACPSS
jgi:hypothetical protein